MAGQTPITVTGNLTADPELRYTSSGTPVASFTVAATERTMNRETGKYEDAGTTYLRCNAWRELAENLSQSASKGTRVMITGLLRQRDWQDSDGNKRTSYEVQAEEAGISLRWATAKVSRTARSSSPAPDDPWSNGTQHVETRPEPPIPAEPGK
jgi:single-strand DNA-binding protein